MKARWNRKDCGCTKGNLPRAGRVMVRCSRHRGKPCKDDRVLCYFDGDGIVRKEIA